MLRRHGQLICASRRRQQCRTKQQIAKPEKWFERAAQTDHALAMLSLCAETSLSCSRSVENEMALQEREFQAAAPPEVLRVSRHVHDLHFR